MKKDNNIGKTTQAQLSNLWAYITQECKSGDILKLDQILSLVDTKEDELRNLLTWMNATRPYEDQLKNRSIFINKLKNRVEAEIPDPQARQNFLLSIG